METKLVEYGIADERSDIRAHVSDNIIFVFPTSDALAQIGRKEYQTRKAWQPGHSEPTAKGFLLPHKDILDCRRIKFYWQYFSWFRDDWDTGKKGRWAVACVIEALRAGRFPLWIDAKQNTDIQLDISGTDILLYAGKRIQVKCDYPAERTGNLYIQTHELNPLKLY